MEMCKDFSQAFASYANALDDGSDESKAFIKYATGYHSRRRRESLLSDARSISPKSLNAFDCDRLLLNLQNGTFDLRNMTLQKHSATDYITKIAKAKYASDTICERWELFIREIMCGDMNTAHFLQKAMGYCLSGDTSLECLFILYGSTTRNGKSTLTETIAHILGEYARTAQPQSLTRRPSDGGVASPDIARLKGARLINVPEPEKAMELNTALIKQFTGGDTYTARYLNENPVEFRPEGKIFINTNHLPNTADNTMFTSGRVKLIPFDRHFTDEEQDTELKKLFRRQSNMSGILNWLIAGYKLLLDEGLSLPARVKTAIDEYRLATDGLGAFVIECLEPAGDKRIKTSELRNLYNTWAKRGGFPVLNSQAFVGELRNRYTVKPDCKLGNVLIGYAVKKVTAA
jgi:putative DNA primase/helicase